MRAKFTSDLTVTATVPAWKANRLLSERVIENPGMPVEQLREELVADLAAGIVVPRKRKAANTTATQEPARQAG